MDVCVLAPPSSSCVTSSLVTACSTSTNQHEAMADHRKLQTPAGEITFYHKNVSDTSLKIWIKQTQSFKYLN